MRVRALASRLYDAALRMFPHRAPTGLVEIGRPGRDAPVLVSGNYTLTVRRLEQALAGADVFLLVADSDGINVWCAAGGGHLTHHDVISVVRTSGIGERVDHRMLVLPQLGATGIERHFVTEATGWDAKWGPAHLEDLPAYLARGLRASRAERKVRFPLPARLEMAFMWGLPMSMVAAAVGALVGGASLAAGGAAAVAAMVAGIFSLIPWVPVAGRRRWVTHLGAAVVGTGVAVGVVALSGGDVSVSTVVASGAMSAAAMGVLAIDLPGTTPWYPSALEHDRLAVDLIEERCTGAADCVTVCPRGVLRMDGAARKVRIVHPDDCIECGACIVQCPQDALRFRAPDGRVVEPETLRRTRLNLLGRRTVEVP